MKAVILKSAFKHGISETAINHCLLTVRNEAIINAEPEKRLIVGFDHNANPLEIIGVVDNGVLFVIHAMKLREKNFYLLEESSEL